MVRNSLHCGSSPNRCRQTPLNARTIRPAGRRKPHRNPKAARPVRAEALNGHRQPVAAGSLPLPWRLPSAPSGCIPNIPATQPPQPATTGCQPAKPRPAESASALLPRPGQATAIAPAPRRARSLKPQAPATGCSGKRDQRTTCGCLLRLSCAETSAQPAPGECASGVRDGAIPRPAHD